MLREGDNLGDGRFRVRHLLAHGGQADVFLADDLADDTVVAVKSIPLSTPTRMARYQAEVRALREVQHQNVVRVLHSEVLHNQGMLVMELAEGGSLGDWVARFGALPPRLAVEVLLQACEGVAAIHANGVIHRDIKPQNLLLWPDRTCKISDFGVARTLDRVTVTAVGQLIGTFAYMAPELRTSPGRATVQTDIYALAATLHTLLTDRFEPDLFMWDRQPRVLDGVPPSLVSTLKRALAWDPQLRHASAAALAAELAAADLPALPPEMPPFPMTLPLRPPRTWVNSSRSEATILVIDDDLMMLKMVEVVLQFAGWRVLAADSGRAALRMLDTESVSVLAVITDVVLPGESGPELITALKRAVPGVPMAFMSAYSPERAEASGVQHNGVFLQKPFLPERLLALVESMVMARTIPEHQGALG